MNILSYEVSTARGQGQPKRTCYEPLASTHPGTQGIDADDKRSSRLNVMAHLLSLLPYEQPQLTTITLPKRQKREYQRPPKDAQHFIRERYKVV